MVFAPLLAAVSLIGSASAFSIIAPGGPNVWWVAHSENTMIWTCHDNPPAQVYQLLLNNTNQNILTSPIAIDANLANADCSHTITTQQAQLTPATGYTLVIADQIDQRTIYATSQEFEVKQAGSAFPATSATPTDTTGASATGSASASASAASSSASSSSDNKSSAMGLSVSLAGVVGVLGVALGML